MAAAITASAYDKHASEYRMIYFALLVAAGFRPADRSL